MKPDFEKVKEQVLLQNEENKVFSNNDPLEVALMVKEEACELVSELEKAFITDDLTAVAGELGDCFYLLIRMADLLGVSLLDVAEMKRKRNLFKYTEQPDVKTAKEEWTAKGGDKWFYTQYLNFLASDHEF